MRQQLCALLLFGLLLGNDAMAQTPQLSHAIQGHAADVRTSPAPLAAGDTIRLLAVMVQFQTDTDTRTSGNGRFDTSTTVPADLLIDAPPRDAGYFQDHLTFLTNYYRKVSKGKVTITSTLIPQIITLPAVLGSYSPPKSGTNVNVANLARDTWQAVDAAGLVPNFASYNCYVLFHAGVGRDVDLVATLQYDPTPLDIPSLYLGPSAFKSLLGTSGIPVNGGAYLIPNTIVIPETENRLLPGITGDVPLELGINGLLCASVGNYLGLPDLFNTKNGATAIGRFGLMDGQGIFSFSGAFPPEPSAWEKYWLGWIHPFETVSATQTVTLPAASLVDSVVRVPISPTEYYLIENRNRDARRDGMSVTTKYRGVTTTRVFTKDTTGFYDLDITSLGGTIIDVDEPDWSLPGGVGSDGTFYDGGILIWHVDEGVISRTIATNAVNADAAHPGLDVEEADGSQDIGKEFGTFSGGSGSENGTALDYWFTGNASPVYKNSFSASTFPSTAANSGAATGITVKDFTARGPRMSFTVSRGTTQLAPLAGYPKFLHRRLAARSLSTAQLTPGGAVAILVATTGDSLGALVNNAPSGLRAPARLYAWDVRGAAAMPGGRTTGDLLVLPTDDFVSPASVADLDGDGTAEAAAVVSGASSGLRLVGIQARDGNADGLADQLFNLPLQGEKANVLILDSAVVAADGRGRVFLYRKDGSPLDNYRPFADTTGPVSIAVSLSSGRKALLAAKGTGLHLSVRTGPGSRPADVTAVLPYTTTSRTASGSSTRNGQAGLLQAVHVGNNGIQLFTESLAQQQIVPTVGSPEGQPVVCDVDGDGLRDVVAFSGRTVYAVHHNGVALDYYPVTLAIGDTITSSPVVGDVDGDGAPEIIAVTRDGAVHALTQKGSSLPGFPVSAGTGRHSVALVQSGDSLCLFVSSSDDGSVYGWRTGKRSVTPLAGSQWLQEAQDGSFASFDPNLPAGGTRQSEFFPAARAYNWPNPVYGDKTSIRYYVASAATVSIKVYDLAGDLVTELSGPGVAGVDNEVTWDVSGIQSGVYFARIEAAGASASATTIVKIAVVK